MYKDISLDFDIDRYGQSISLNIEGYCNYFSGSYNSSPECDADITSALDENNNNWMQILSIKEKENIISYIIDAATYSD